MLGPSLAPRLANNRWIRINSHDAGAAARGHETEVARVATYVQNRSGRQFPQRFRDESFLSRKLLGIIIIPFRFHIPQPCGSSSLGWRQTVQRTLQTVHQRIENEAGLFGIVDRFLPVDAVIVLVVS